MDAKGRGVLPVTKTHAESFHFAEPIAPASAGSPSRRVSDIISPAWLRSLGVHLWPLLASRNGAATREKPASAPLSRRSSERRRTRPKTRPPRKTSPVRLGPSLRLGGSHAGCTSGPATRAIILKSRPGHGTRWRRTPEAGSPPPPATPTECSCGSHPSGGPVH